MCQLPLMVPQQHALEALLMWIYMVERTFRYWEKHPKSRRVADTAACTFSGIYCFMCIGQIVLINLQ